ncbi:hypothetical protein B0A50_05966 [Salinomyces thailandicus]|uniref:Xylanolytic transcriptional activator regulatory domain-containing protein n=1 Tax=Salinomyces thailandicus TaxID=706561 RepID=A0A4U0TQS6_9PEZI|nr:hypothetical protein B0A50_05966 [Salinomyces thailandica]
MEDASLLLGLNSGHAVSSNLTQNGGEGHKYDTDNLIMDNSNFPDFFEQIMMSNTDLGRQQPANMPFDVSNFTQDLTFDSCDFDFSFLSSGLTRPPTAQAHRLELSDNPGQTPQSDAQLRSEAFEKSPWSWNHWIPERNSHAFSGQEEINIQEDRLQSADQLTSPGSIRLVHVDIDQAARDRMIRVVTKVAHQQLSMPSFPSLELLVDLVDVFLLQDSNSVDSYVHAATFNCKTTRTELLLAMVAAGARYIALPPVWKMGLVIQEVVRLAMGDVFEGDNSTTRELQSLQTVLLWLGIGAFSGFRRKTEIALSFLQSPITMLVWSNAFGRSRYKDIVPDVNDSDEALDSKWRAWAAQESLKRLIIYTFIHDSQVAMINMRNTLISPAQLQIPLPASRQMWLAPNAQAWRNTYYGLGLPGIQTNTLTMLEFFGNNKLLQNLGDTVDHQLCMLAACHGLGHEVWNFRQQGRILIHWRNQGRRDRWLAHQTHQRDLSDDLVAMHAHCELRGDSSLESLLTLELLLMTLHVDFEDVQTFSGKSGEEEARKVFPRVREWSESAEARTALKHAGKVFQVAKAFEKTKLRDFYSVAVYHAALTLWVYGMVLSNTASRSGAPTPMNGSAPPRSSIGGLLSPPEQRVCLDNGDDRAVRAFTLLGQGTPGIQDVDSAFVPLTNCKGLMLTAAAVLKKNFPQSSNGLPALVENLANLMNDLAKLSRKE